MTIVDQGLPTLATALSQPGRAEVIKLSGLSPAPDASNRRADIIKHVPGRRATVLYSFGGQTTAAKRVTGKLYRSKRRAARIYGWLQQLEADLFPIGGQLRVPHPLALSDALSMVLLEYIDGVDLRHVVDASEPDPFIAAARWLAQLHSAEAPDYGRTRTLPEEVRKAIDWLDDVVLHVTDDMAARLNRARTTMISLLSDPPPVDLCTVHRDFYYANVLWDGERLWAIDLDQLRVGDPALDVGHFLGHLETLAYVRTGSFNAYDLHAQQFLAAYQDANPAHAVAARLPVYRAYTFLKLAATAAKRGLEGWLGTINALSQRACEELT